MWKIKALKKKETEAPQTRKVEIHGKWERNPQIVENSSKMSEEC